MTMMTTAMTTTTTATSKTKPAIFQSRHSGLGRLRVRVAAFDANATSLIARAIGEHLDAIKVPPLRRAKP
jgi:hypothetical protein